jgi:hypothetical protein
MYFLSLFFFNPKIITKHNLKVAKKKKGKKERGMELWMEAKTES